MRAKCGTHCSSYLVYTNNVESHLAQQQHADAGEAAERGGRGGTLERGGPLRGRRGPLQPGDEVCPHL